MDQQTNNQSGRQSNFELLRIVSMFLVLLAHYVPTRDSVTKDALLNDTFATLCTIELHSLAIVCVHCFMLISGYFGIKLSWKSFTNLFYQMLFWSGASVLTAAAIGLPVSVGLFLKGIVWGVVSMGIYRADDTLPGNQCIRGAMRNARVGTLYSCVLSFQHCGRILDGVQGLSFGHERTEFNRALSDRSILAPV